MAKGKWSEATKASVRFNNSRETERLHRELDSACECVNGGEFHQNRRFRNILASSAWGMSVKESRDPDGGEGTTVLTFKDGSMIVVNPGESFADGTVIK